MGKHPRDALREQTITSPGIPVMFMVYLSSCYFYPCYYIDENWRGNARVRAEPR